MLLDKTYNKIQPRRKPGARPTVLYITTENSVEESLIRLFNISTSSKDIQSFAPAEAVRLMREKGGLSLKDGETNIIMKYYGNLESVRLIYILSLMRLKKTIMKSLPWCLTILNVFAQQNQRKMKLCV